MLQNLSSAAVVIGALKVKAQNSLLLLVVLLLLVLLFLVVVVVVVVVVYSLHAGHFACFIVMWWSFLPFYIL